MPFVIDNAVVSGWYLENQTTRYTEAIAERWRDDRAVVPALWKLELTNVLRPACLRQRMTAQKAQQVLVRMAMLPITVDRVGAPPHELLALALRFGFGNYDADYLQLALPLQLPVATAEGALKDAALASGVGWVGGGTLIARSHPER